MSGFLDALTDPGVDALLGAAQGFGQAAMPTRMPTPWGAVIGMGAGGALAGAKEGQGLQLQQQQVKAAQMQNQATSAELPATLGLANFKSQLFQNPDRLQAFLGGASGSGAVPSGAPSPPQPGATTPSAVAPQPDYGKANAAALASLPDDKTRSMAINAALTSGLPQAAWAPWIAGNHNESGWNLNAPDHQNANGTTDIGPGQLNTGTLPTLGMTEAQARDPQTNLNGSAAYFKRQWMVGGGDPGKAMAGYNTGSPAGSAPDYVSSGVGRLSQWGYPGTAPQAASPGGLTASDAQARANALYQQANDLDRTNANRKFLGLPAGPGDPAAIRAQAAEYQKMALAGPTAAATAQAQAAAERTKLITTRAGVFDPVSGKEIYRQPEYHELQDPNTGQEYPAFVQPGDNGQLAIMGGPPGMVPGTVPPSKLGPGQEDTIKHLADQYANEDKAKYEGATNSLFQLDQQDKNIAALNAGGGWSSTGAAANAKMEWAKGVNSAFQTLGIQPPFDPTKVSSWEDATKIQTQLAFAQAKQLGSREAQQVISMARAATPGAENTPEGYRAISSDYHEMNNREVDLYNFKTAWLQNHGGNLTGAETAFNNQFTPQMYAARAVSNIQPVQINDSNLLSRYLPGTFVTDGKTISPKTGKPMIVQVPSRPGAPPMPDYLQPGG